MKQEVDFGQQDHGQKQISSLFLDDRDRPRVIRVARVIQGEHTARVADQGHSPSLTA
jgi:hypothetical protein